MNLAYNIKIAEDLGVDNEVMLLSSVDLRCKVSGVSVIVSPCSLAASQIAALEAIHATIKKDFPEYESWLMIGNSIWQPDTQIMRYKRLWTYLDQNSEFRIPHERRTPDYLITSTEGLKYFGGVRADDISAKDVAKILRHQLASVLVYIDKAKALKLVNEIAAEGWTKKGLPWPPSFINRICEEEFFICTLFGEFDDCEGGGLVTSVPKFIDRCFRNGFA